MRPLALALLLPLGCASPPPATPPAEATLRPPPAPRPLAECGADLSGLWRHSEDDGFRYLARDDGGVLVLEARHRSSDGGLASSQVILVRSGDSFVGGVGVVRAAADAGCAALFPAEVVSCADAGLVVATVDRLQVDSACRPVVEAPSSRRLHRLVRVASDAGPQ